MLSEKPWNLEAAGLLFLGILSALLVASIPMWVVQHFGAKLPKEQLDFFLMMISSVSMQGAIFGLTVLLVDHFDTTWKEAFFRGAELPKAVAYGVLGGAVFVPLGQVMLMLCDKILTRLHLSHADQDLVLEMQNPNLHIAQRAALGIMAVVVAPLAEELFFRGVLYPAVRRKLGRNWAVWLTSIIFAMVHVNAVSFVPLVALGLLLAVLYETFDNLAAPMVAHSVFNVANFVMILLPGAKP